jgi:hypothetical protein
MPPFVQRQALAYAETALHKHVPIGMCRRTHCVQSETVAQACAGVRGQAVLHKYVKHVPVVSDLVVALWCTVVPSHVMTPQKWVRAVGEVCKNAAEGARATATCARVRVALAWTIIHGCLSHRSDAECEGNPVNELEHHDVGGEHLGRV